MPALVASREALRHGGECDLVMMPLMRIVQSKRLPETRVQSAQVTAPFCGSCLAWSWLLPLCSALVAAQ